MLLILRLLKILVYCACHAYSPVSDSSMFVAFVLVARVVRAVVRLVFAVLCGMVESYKTVTNAFGSNGNGSSKNEHNKVKKPSDSSGVINDPEDHNKSGVDKVDPGGEIDQSLESCMKMIQDNFNFIALIKGELELSSSEQLVKLGYKALAPIDDRWLKQMEQHSIKKSKKIK